MIVILDFAAAARSHAVRRRGGAAVSVVPDLAGQEAYELAAHGGSYVRLGVVLGGDRPSAPGRRPPALNHAFGIGRGERERLLDEAVGSPVAEPDDCHLQLVRHHERSSLSAGPGPRRAQC